MDSIIWDNKEVLHVNVESGNHLNEEDIRSLSLKPGLCLKNSYEVAKIKNCKMVEGFLVTRYKDKPLECVAHVWNEIEGKHFDYTIDLKQHNEQIESHSYYLVEAYDLEEKKVEIRFVEDFNPQTFVKTQKRQEHLTFKTQTKEREKEMLQYLRSLAL
ncbi:MAG TPA: hypothetical protein VK154_11655 [Chitinophagales bacterium]|nr:hypothetical protein [Chitinophagales bacterium]